MAKPRETAKPDPPVESEEEEESGEEEEEGSSAEGSESESEPEQEPSLSKAASTSAAASKKPESGTQNAQAVAAAASSSDESDDEESGSDTDSDTETLVKKPDPSIKPIASKPMDDPQKSTGATKKPRSRPNSSGPTSPTKSATVAGGKRAAAGGDEGNDAKRSKKKLEVEAESPDRKGNSNDDSRKLFQRLWSEDDEIAILKGMLDYSVKKKADPIADLNAFHEFIKKNIHIDVSRTQLQDKIRRLKKKYENNVEREKKGNKEINFSKLHEQKVYELSKKVWGKEKIGGGEENVETPKANGSAVRKSRSRSAVASLTPKVDEGEEKQMEAKDLVSEKNVLGGLKNVSFGPDTLTIEEWVLKNRTDLIKDAKKRAELEEKWRELKVKEIELFARRSELMAEQAKLILDDLK